MSKTREQLIRELEDERIGHLAMTHLAGILPFGRLVDHELRAQFCSLMIDILRRPGEWGITLKPE